MNSTLFRKTGGQVRSKLGLLGLLGLAGLGAMAEASAQQQVQIDRYRGSQALPVTTPPTTPITPNYVNVVGGATGQDDALSNLLAFAANPANLELANHTTRANFPLMETDAVPLICDNMTRSPDACTRQIKGLVAYTLVKFPVAGVYQFWAGHDDRLQLAVANAGTAPANYRLGSLYTEHHRFTTLVDWYPPSYGLASAAGAPFTVTAGTCVLVRATLNNGWGGARLRLGWRYGADASAQATATPIEMPASALFNPADPASYVDCGIQAANQSVSTTPNTPVTLPLPATPASPAASELQVTGGVVDPNSLVLTTPPAHGAVSCTPAGCTYTPAPGFSGVETFSYRVCLRNANFDGTPVCGTAQVTVNTPAGAAPAPVPTLSTWGLGMLSVVLGIAFARRRKTKA